jgi:hypothetical protein
MVSGVDVPNQSNEKLVCHVSKALINHPLFSWFIPLVKIVNLGMVDPIALQTSPIKRPKSHRSPWICQMKASAGVSV